MKKRKTESGAAIQVPEIRRAGSRKAERQHEPGVACLLICMDNVNRDVQRGNQDGLNVGA